MELSSFVKRAIVDGIGGPGDDIPKYELPSWTWIVVLVDLIILVPVLLIVRTRPPAPGRRRG